MRALTIDQHGGLDQLVVRDDVPPPTLVYPTDVRIKVSAAALNHLDLFVVSGLPGVNITPPWIMGADATGTVESVGSAVRGIAVGDTVVVNPGISDRTCEYCRAGEQPLCVKFRLLGEHLPGSIAEYLVVPAPNVRKIPAPPDIGRERAAAFTLATLTAWRMVVSRAKVKKDDHVLIWGIGGGVALAALAICKLIGARVTVTSGSDDKLARARSLGADDVINHRAMDVGREVRGRTGKRGVDVVIDNVGHDTWQQSLGALGRAGRLVTCGATSGPMVETDVRRLFWNQWTIMGSTMGNDAEFDEIVPLLAGKQIVPVVDSAFPMSEGRAAFERLGSPDHFGKVVILVN